MLIIVLFTGCYFFWEDWDSRRIKESHFRTEQQSPNDVAYTFLLSLAADRTESTKSFVVEEVWDEMINRAERIHVRFEECEYSRKPYVGMYKFDRRLPSEKPNLGRMINLNCSGTEISIKGSIDLIEIDGNWFVCDWRLVQLEYR
ncbi:MAG: hypothetical protein AAF490_01145 [Chloroflexota bacterium]